VRGYCYVPDKRVAMILDAGSSSNDFGAYELRSNLRNATLEPTIAQVGGIGGRK